MTKSQIYKAEAVQNLYVLQNYMIFITVIKEFMMLLKHILSQNQLENANAKIIK